MARKYHQGRYNVQKPEKYLGDHRKVIYRSSWELKMFMWAEANNNVLKWNSEEVVVPYISPFDGRPHRYFVDMYVEIVENGRMVKKLYEIKPNSERFLPKKPKRITKGYINRLKTYAINQAKWKAAYKYCEEKGINFSLITEKQLGL